MHHFLVYVEPVSAAAASDDDAHANMTVRPAAKASTQSV